MWTLKWVSSGVSGEGAALIRASVSDPHTSLRFFIYIICCTSFHISLTL